MNLFENLQMMKEYSNSNSIKKFKDIETGEIMTLDDLKNYWDNEADDILKQEYNNNFDDYLKCCMTDENGTLEIYEE